MLTVSVSSWVSMDYFPGLPLALKTGKSILKGKRKTSYPAI